MLDGEGGYAVWANAIPGRQKPGARRACRSASPTRCKLKRPVARDRIVSFDDVELDHDLDVVALRKQMEGAARLSPARTAA